MRNQPGLAEWLDGGDFTLTSVLSIDERGTEDTWDLNIDGSHNFVADGVVVHNSGIVSAAWNILHGRAPYNHTFSTGSLPGSFFPKPGTGGALTAGWAHPGQRGASANVGHMAGMLAGGLKFESTGSGGVRVGAGASSVSSFAHQGHFAGGGLVPVAKVATADFGQVTLSRGWNMVKNGTGQPEPLSTNNSSSTDDLIRELIVAVSRLAGEFGREMTGMQRGVARAARQV